MRIPRLPAACGLIAIALALAGCGGGSSARGTSSTRTSTATSSSVAKLSVVAAGLANPRQLSVAADGAIYVAEAGNGGVARCAKTVTSGTPICAGATGSIARVEGGRAVSVVAGLPSVAAAGGQQASGPADVVAAGSKLAFVIQDTDISSTGANQFGSLGKPLGRLGLANTDGTELEPSADLGRYEATHNPDHGAGAAAANRLESDPYSLAPYRGGYAVADAAANDLLWVDAAGAVHLIAVFPTQTEKPPGGPATVAQSVPTSVVVGPDGALYVGELTGAPFTLGAARVWRVVPGRAPTVYASGFTDISAIAFDRAGRLLVLEINKLGLTHPSGSGELIRVGADRSRTVLLGGGLVSPTGLAVGTDGSIYISNYGSSPSTGPAPHGEILRLSPS